MLEIAPHFNSVPKPIELHQLLSQLSLVLKAHLDCPEAIEMLFRRINNIHLGSKYNLMTLYVQDIVPTTTVIREFRGMSAKSPLARIRAHSRFARRTRSSPFAGNIQPGLIPVAVQKEFSFAL